MFTSCCTCANRSKFKEAPKTILTIQTVDHSFLKICSALDLFSPLALGPRPFSGRERVGPFWSLRARASLRLSSPSILSCRSRLGPPGGALSLLKVHSGTRSLALRRVQTTSPCFFLGFASACQPVGCPCQSSEALAPLVLYTSFLHTPSYTSLSLSKIPFSGAKSKEPPKCH